VTDEALKKSILSLLGISMKAGKIKAGEFQTEEAVKSQEARLVIIAADASENTKKKFSDKCTFYEVPVFIFGTKEELARAIGKENRSSMAVTDEGLAGSLITKLSNLEKTQEEPA
jgi:ribosomal protein L7Ae-like RNA K-turn-binding protein